MKLTLKQRDALWGEDGPYSEAHLIFETRILDDRISRIFLIVEVHVNPFTFELLRKHRKLFHKDLPIQQFLDHSEYRGQANGYVSCAYMEEYHGGDQLEKANKILGMCEQTIIKMHKFVLTLIDKQPTN